MCFHFSSENKAAKAKRKTAIVIITHLHPTSLAPTPATVEPARFRAVESKQGKDEGRISFLVPSFFLLFFPFVPKLSTPLFRLARKLCRF